MVDYRGWLGGILGAIAGGTIGIGMTHIGDILPIGSLKYSALWVPLLVLRSLVLPLAAGVLSGWYVERLVA